MSKGLFVTSTGTDIGKTYVTALIVKKLRQAEWNAGYYKAVLSGAEKTENGLLPGDADHVNNVANLHSDLANMVSYVYMNAVSPHLAAQLEGNPATLEKIHSDYKRLCSDYDYITVEGSGGIICPIRYDNEKQIFLEDIIKALKLPAIVIAGAGLGTINTTVLTVRYMESRDIRVKGIIFNHYTGSFMEDDNKKMVEEITGIPVIALVKKNDEDLDIDMEKLISLYE